MLKRSFLVATALSVVAAPAVASAATVTVDKPCYSAGFVGGPEQNVGFTLAGFPASTSVEVRAAGDVSILETDAAGSFLGQFPVGTLGDRIFRRTFPIDVRTSDGTVGASTSYTVAAAAVKMTPPVARPTTKVSYKAQGFVGGRFLYAHYAYTKSPVSHPLVKTVKLGALKGPCGDLTTKKAKQLPLAKLKRKTVYEIQFDTSPTFRRQQGLHIVRTVFVP